MLTRDLALYEYDQDRVNPDRLTKEGHHRYPAMATAMLSIYGTGIGRTREKLHRGVEAVFETENDCPPKRICAFCKILDEMSEYDAAGNAWLLRRDVLRRATEKHPLARTPASMFQNNEANVKAEIATELGRSWMEIERDYFADSPGLHRLSAFSGPTDPRDLLSLYNLRQTQVALFDAEQLCLDLTADYKPALRAVKLAHLLHDITCVSPGHYRVRVDGPVSVIRETTRYGVNMAKLLPVLVSLRGWDLCAAIRPRRNWRGGLTLHLSPKTGLKAPLGKNPDFDSEVERKFFEKWGADSRNGWSCHREDEILHRGQKVFFPDFVFRRSDGRIAYLEIVGFWTVKYLQAKRETLKQFVDEPIAIAIGDAARGGFVDLGLPVIPYRESLQLKPVLEWLASFSR